MVNNTKISYLFSFHTKFTASFDCESNLRWAGAAHALCINQRKVKNSVLYLYSIISPPTWHRSNCRAYATEALHHVCTRVKYTAVESASEKKLDSLITYISKWHNKHWDRVCCVLESVDSVDSPATERHSRMWRLWSTGDSVSRRFDHTGACLCRDDLIDEHRP